MNFSTERKSEGDFKNVIKEGREEWKSNMLKYKLKDDKVEYDDKESKVKRERE